MHEDFDLSRELEQQLARLMAEISSESYERLGPGLRELGLALAERREALREVNRVEEALSGLQGLYERAREAYEGVLERYERAKEDLQRADERAQNALRLLKDAL
jgi:chromosome segregation ATPase